MTNSSQHMIKMKTELLLTKLMVYYYYFTLAGIFCNNQVLERHKRFLLWPYADGTRKVQVITGVGLPVDLERETAIVGLVFKANYFTPANISEVVYPTTYARKKRGLSRWDIYKFLSFTADMRGLSGRACILRAICEVADSPVDTNYGLFDEIIHTMLTPSSTDEQLNHHTDNEYFMAQKIGFRREGKCHEYFPECDLSLLDLITEYNYGAE